MSQVEEYYPEPSQFRPERYLGIDKATMDTIDPRNYVFGFGRRFVLCIHRAPIVR